MNHWALAIMLLIAVAVVAGCAGTIVSNESSGEPQVQEAFNEFESTLLDETSDVEIGDLI